MVNVAVIGAGPAGLATSLFLARRGHRVTLIEKDTEAPPDDPETCFQSWSRRGVAQARQPHLLLGRSSRILQSEAPDVLDALAEAGARFVTMNLEPVDPHQSDVLYVVAARRLVFEAVLRRQVLAEAGVRWRSGTEVTGLVLRRDRATPVVTAVTLDDGEEITADLTVDASGRYSHAPQWLEAAAIGPLEENFQDCGFCYMTRWYRMRPGEVYPVGPMPIGIISPYASFFGFLADGDTFCLGMTLSMRDPLAAIVRTPETFERVLASIPELAGWRLRAEPISDINVLGRIENRSRTLLKDGAPVVAGFVLLGDSAMHTNPTRGRGVTMAYVQAQWLAEAVSERDPTSAEFGLDFETWRTRELSLWFDSQVQADGARIAAMDAVLAGEALRVSEDPASQFASAVQALAPNNPAVATAFSRVFHMLETPAEMAADPAVRAAVSTYLAAGGRPPPMTGPSRETFCALAAG